MIRSARHLLSLVLLASVSTTPIFAQFDDGLPLTDQLGGGGSRSRSAPRQTAPRSIPRSQPRQSVPRPTQPRMSQPHSNGLNQAQQWINAGAAIANALQQMQRQRQMQPPQYRRPTYQPRYPSTYRQPRQTYQRPTYLQRPTYQRPTYQPRQTYAQQPTYQQPRQTYTQPRPTFTQPRLTYTQPRQTYTQPRYTQQQRVTPPRTNYAQPQSVQRVQPQSQVPRVVQQQPVYRQPQVVQPRVVQTQPLVKPQSVVVQPSRVTPTPQQTIVKSDPVTAFQPRSPTTIADVKPQPANSVPPTRIVDVKPRPSEQQLRQQAASAAARQAAERTRNRRSAQNNSSDGTAENPASSPSQQSLADSRREAQGREVQAQEAARNRAQQQQARERSASLAAQRASERARQRNANQVASSNNESRGSATQGSQNGADKKPSGLTVNQSRQQLAQQRQEAARAAQTARDEAADRAAERAMERSRERERQTTDQHADSNSRQSIEDRKRDGTLPSDWDSEFIPQTTHAEGPEVGWEDAFGPAQRTPNEDGFYDGDGLPTKDTFADGDKPTESDSDRFRRESLEEWERGAREAHERRNAELRRQVAAAEQRRQTARQGEQQDEARHQRTLDGVRRVAAEQSSEWRQALHDAIERGDKREIASLYREALGRQIDSGQRDADFWNAEAQREAQNEFIAQRVLEASRAGVIAIGGPASTAAALGGIGAAGGASEGYHRGESRAQIAARTGAGFVGGVKDAGLAQLGRTGTSLLPRASAGAAGDGAEAYVQGRLNGQSGADAARSALIAASSSVAGEVGGEYVASTPGQMATDALIGGGQSMANGGTFVDGATSALQSSAAGRAGGRLANAGARRATNPTRTTTRPRNTPTGDVIPQRRTPSAESDGNLVLGTPVGGPSAVQPGLVSLQPDLTSSRHPTSRPPAELVLPQSPRDVGRADNGHQGSAAQVLRPPVRREVPEYPSRRGDGAHLGSLAEGPARPPFEPAQGTPHRPAELSDGAHSGAASSFTTRADNGHQGSAAQVLRPPVRREVPEYPSHRGDGAHLGSLAEGPVRPPFEPAPGTPHRPAELSDGTHSGAAARTPEHTMVASEARDKLNRLRDIRDELDPNNLDKPNDLMQAQRLQGAERRVVGEYYEQYVNQPASSASASPGLEGEHGRFGIQAPGELARDRAGRQRQLLDHVAGNSDHRDPYKSWSTSYRSAVKAPGGSVNGIAMADIPASRLEAQIQSGEAVPVKYNDLALTQAERDRLSGEREVSITSVDPENWKIIKQEPDQKLQFDERDRTGGSVGYYERDGERYYRVYRALRHFDYPQGTPMLYPNKD